MRCNEQSMESVVENHMFFNFTFLDALYEFQLGKINIV